MLSPELTDGLCWGLSLSIVVQDGAKLSVVNTAVPALIIVIEDHSQVLYKNFVRQMLLTYHAISEDDTNFGDCPPELVLCHAALVLNIEEFERLLQELRFLLCRRTLLRQLGLEVLLEPEKMSNDGSVK